MATHENQAPNIYIHDTNADAARWDSDWIRYGNRLDGTRVAGPSPITATTANRLRPAWRFTAGGPVTGTPIVVDGTVLIGSYDGSLYALDATDGTPRWSFATGATAFERDMNVPLGISGSATVAEGVVYVGDADAVVHALDLADGRHRWSVSVEAAPNGSIWSSPVVVEDQVVVGVASVAKEAGFRGSVVALDRADGAIRWQTHMTPAGVDGAGVFAVPAIDLTRRMVFAATQNAYTARPAPYGQVISMVALDLDSGALRWAMAAAPNDGQTSPVADFGFSASPGLATAVIDGRPRDLVIEGQKSGVLWALDRDTGEVVWQTAISPPGPLGGMEGTAAISAGGVVVPATRWLAWSEPAAGLVSGVDPADGRVRWIVDLPRPAAAAATIVNDLALFATLDGHLHGFGVRDGAHVLDLDLGRSANGGVAVAGDLVVVGAGTPAFAPFIVPGADVVAFRLEG